MFYDWITRILAMVPRKGTRVLKIVLIFIAIALPVLLTTILVKSTVTGGPIETGEVLPARIEEFAPTFIGPDDTGMVERLSVNVLDEKVRILLMADFRTGSSFTSEIFNQNEDFFYIFEPGRLLVHHMKRQKVPETLFKVRHRQLLEKMFQCEFDGLDSYFDEMSRLTRYEQHREIRTLSETCTNVNKTMSCPPVSPQLLRELCEKKKHIAIKTIRVGSVLEVAHLTDENTKLHIIQIIRDPRGRFSSWMTLKRGKKTVYDPKDIDRSDLAPSNTYCRNSLENYVILQTSDYFKGRYSIVRYEDMAEKPWKCTEILYRDVGLIVPPNIKQWLTKNTVAETEENGGTFGTSRLSKEQSQYWRQKLTFEATKKVEYLASCQKMLSAFGYKSVKYPKLLTDRNTSLVVNIPTFNISEFYSDWINY